MCRPCVIPIANTIGCYRFGDRLSGQLIDNDIASGSRHLLLYDTLKLRSFLVRSLEHVYVCVCVCWLFLLQSVSTVRPFPRQWQRLHTPGRFLIHLYVSCRAHCVRLCVSVC